MRGRARASLHAGVAAVLSGCICIAAGTLLTKRLLEAVPALPAACLQIGFGAAASCAYAAATGRLPRPGQRMILALPGVLQPGLAFVLGLAGLAVTAVSIEAMLAALEPVLVMLFAWLWLGERPGRPLVAAVALGAVGVLLLAAGAAPGAAFSLGGAALLLAAVAFAALDTVVSRGLVVRADPVALTAASSLAGLLVAGATVPLWPGGWTAALTPRTVLLAVGSGTLLHAAAVICMNAGLARLTAGTAASLFPLISLLTACGGAYWFGDELTLAQVAGGAIIVSASLIVARAG